MHRVVLASLLLCLCSLSSVQAQGTPSNNSTEAQLKSALLADLEFLRLNVLSFWARHGLDNVYGGIHGTLDRAGTPISPTAKGLLQQTRHIWAFSTHYIDKSNTSAAANASAAGAAGAPLNSTEQLAQSTFDFVVQNMQDTNNSLWYWNVSRNGSLPVQRNKVITGQLFVLIGFSQYFQAFGDPTARDLALRTFRVIDDAWHTPTFGGYIETNINGFPAELPPSSNSTIATSPDDAAIIESANRTDPASAGEVVSASSKTRPNAAGSAGLNSTGNETRSLNVLMHGIDALLALHNATNDTVVGQRLVEFVTIVCQRLERNGSLLYSTYIPATGNGTWQKAADTDTNYGTNLEISWLMLEALDHLQSINTITPLTHDDCTAEAIATGAAAVNEALDTVNGGFYESRSASGEVSTAKVWWIHADAMMTLYKLHEYYGMGRNRSKLARAPGGSQPNYLQLLVDTARFVRQYQTDNEVAGEQFWQVAPNGTYIETSDPDRSTKGNRWKASFYTSRAPLYLVRWIRASPHNGTSVQYWAQPQASPSELVGSGGTSWGVSVVPSVWLGWLLALAVIVL